MQIKIIKDYLSTLNMKNKINTFEDINALIQKHLAEFSFTSIPVLLKNELSLELPKLYEKIILKKRGGYCFEHNKLIYEALEFSGLDVKPLFARVLNNQKIRVPKTHRFTLLEFENERYIVDVGFGFSSPSLAVKFGTSPTTTNLGTSYIINEIEDGIFALQLMKNDELYTLYTFDLTVYHEPDFEMGHFYSHKHPKANFVNNLVLSRILKDEVRSLRNSAYQKISASSVDEVEIKSLEQLENIFRDDFEYPIESDELKYLYENFCINNKI